MEIDGPQPTATPGDQLAIQIYNALSGPTGFNWSGLPILAQIWEIPDLEGLVDRILAIQKFTESA